ncbi:MAG: hypothetical protein HYV65_03120 [Candidatus Spechtbacteria bacterium]|nr:hypothetical protein [Candidatus Spechtbacteria bacterium]
MGHDRFLRYISDRYGIYIVSKHLFFWVVVKYEDDPEIMISSHATFGGAAKTIRQAYASAGKDAAQTADIVETIKKQRAEIHADRKAAYEATLQKQA